MSDGTIYGSNGAPVSSELNAFQIGPFALQFQATAEQLVRAGFQEGNPHAQIQATWAATAMAFQRFAELAGILQIKMQAVEKYLGEVDPDFRAKYKAEIDRIVNEMNAAAAQQQKQNTPELSAEELEKLKSRFS